MHGKARKDPAIFLQPIKASPNSAWEGHHATNPCSIRFGCDSRVFLGYRAGGDADFYFCHHWKVWASHLGLAVLDEYGERITCRLPLPVFTIERHAQLPQSEAEFHEFMKGPHADEILVLHDFRFTEYRDYLYLVYHEGTLADCFDCVVRMPVAEFIAKVDRSLALAAQPTGAIRDAWRALWWAPGVWEPCGYKGTNRIFAGKVIKGDLVYLELEDGTLQLNHRPLAYGVATVNTGDKFYVEPTEDGITRYGVFESNSRPGYLDNSHIGCNGHPSRAAIGGKEVYVDVVHGCQRDFASSRVHKSHIMYFAYLRIKDYRSGELLYYSEDPIIDYGPDWDGEAIEGEWVRINTPLRGVMFAGGQEERVPGKRGVPDEWISYIGLGDTSIALARFTLRELLPAQVIADIQTREQNQAATVMGLAANTFTLPDLINGWRWEVRNNLARRTLEVVRTLPRNDETGIREINSRPGYFDAHGVLVPPGCVQYNAEYNAWVVAYQGLRLLDGDQGKRTQIGYGLVLLWGHNPEQVLYRSMLPMMTEEIPGWSASTSGKSALVLREFSNWIPEPVRRDIFYMNAFYQDSTPFPSQMEKWQREKAGV
jgi:hypothetical protein